ncbi:MAG TPA: HupE/UreJ family protein [Polyangiales bacterium]
MNWLLILVLSWPALAYAHKPSDSYLTLEVRGDEVSGYWDVALRDLDRALAIDDGDGALTGRELLAADLGAALEKLTLRRGGELCRPRFEQPAQVAHSDGNYARVPFSAHCAGGALTLKYDFFFELEPQHRAIVHSGESTYVLSTGHRTETLDAHRTLLADGVLHILSGLDHVLFLLALLLPSVLRRERFAPLARDVLRVISAFTLAHSLTLALAALDVVRMSSAWVEPAIAASVAIAALDNVWPVFAGSRASIAFALGLLHGFGFSSALSDLGLTRDALLWGLLSFNAGVELGQLLLIALLLPLAYVLRNAWLYRFAMVRGGSIAIAVCALVWFVQRVGS